MSSEGIYTKQLIKDIGLVLAVCLQDVVQVWPEDPIDYMAHWLYKFIDNNLYFEKKDGYFKSVRADADMERTERRQSRVTKENFNMHVMRLQALTEGALLQNEQLYSSPVEYGPGSFIQSEMSAPVDEENKLRKSYSRTSSGGKSSTRLTASVRGTNSAKSKTLIQPSKIERLSSQRPSAAGTERSSRSYYYKNSETKRSKASRSSSDSQSLDRYSLRSSDSSSEISSDESVRTLEAPNENFLTSSRSQVRNLTAWETTPDDDRYKSISGKLSMKYRKVSSVGLIKDDSTTSIPGAGRYSSRTSIYGARKDDSALSVSSMRKDDSTLSISTVRKDDTGKAKKKWTWRDIRLLLKRTPRHTLQSLFEEADARSSSVRGSIKEVLVPARPKRAELNKSDEPDYETDSVSEIDHAPLKTESTETIMVDENDIDLRKQVAVSRAQFKDQIYEKISFSSEELEDDPGWEREKARRRIDEEQYKPDRRRFERQKIHKEDEVSKDTSKEDILLNREEHSNLDKSSDIKLKGRKSPKVSSHELVRKASRRHSKHRQVPHEEKTNVRPSRVMSRKDIDEKATSKARQEKMSVDQNTGVVDKVPGQYPKESLPKEADLKYIQIRDGREESFVKRTNGKERESDSSYESSVVHDKARGGRQKTVDRDSASSEYNDDEVTDLQRPQSKTKTRSFTDKMREVDRTGSPVKRFYSDKHVQEQQADYRYSRKSFFSEIDLDLDLSDSPDTPSVPSSENVTSTESLDSQRPDSGTAFKKRSRGESFRATDKTVKRRSFRESYLGRRQDRETKEMQKSKVLSKHEKRMLGRREEDIGPMKQLDKKGHNKMPPEYHEKVPLKSRYEDEMDDETQPQAFDRDEELIVDGEVRIIDKGKKGKKEKYMDKLKDDEEQRSPGESKIRATESTDVYRHRKKSEKRRADEAEDESELQYYSEGKDRDIRTADEAYYTDKGKTRYTDEGRKDGQRYRKAREKRHKYETEDENQLQFDTEDIDRYMGTADEYRDTDEDRKGERQYRKARERKQTDRTKGEIQAEYSTTVKERDDDGVRKDEHRYRKVRRGKQSDSLEDESQAQPYTEHEDRDIEEADEYSGGRKGEHRHRKARERSHMDDMKDERQLQSNTDDIDTDKDRAAVDEYRYSDEGRQEEYQYGKASKRKRTDKTKGEDRDIEIADEYRINDEGRKGEYRYKKGKGKRYRDDMEDESQVQPYSEIKDRDRETADDYRYTDEGRKGEQRHRKAREKRPTDDVEDERQPQAYIDSKDSIDSTDTDIDIPPADEYRYPEEEGRRDEHRYRRAVQRKHIDKTKDDSQVQPYRRKPERDSDLDDENLSLRADKKRDHRYEKGKERKHRDRPGEERRELSPTESEDSSPEHGSPSLREGKAEEDQNQKVRRRRHTDNLEGKKQTPLEYDDEYDETEPRKRVTDSVRSSNEINISRKHSEFEDESGERSARESKIKRKFSKLLPKTKPLPRISNIKPKPMSKEEQPIMPVLSSWYFLKEPGVMVCDHPVLGELRSLMRPQVILDGSIWDKEDVPCEVLYDHDIYVVCDRHADDKQYSSKMLLWTGETWVTGLPGQRSHTGT